MKNTLLILLCFALGLAAGYFELLPDWAHQPQWPLYLLYILMFLVGLSVGGDKNLATSLQKQSYRLFLLPIGTLVGTLVGAACIGWCWPGISVRESMAVGSGMGYYSLSSILISHSHGPELGSVALMSNIFRELLTLFSTPFLVRAFGKLAPIAAGGATSMDITLPVIVKFSGKEYAALAVFHGVILDACVPILLGII